MMSRLAAIVLCLLVLCVGMTVSPVPSLADDADDFGLGEVDPDLPNKIKKWNADCLSCHSEEGVKNPPRKGMDLKLLATLTVDQTRFEHSDHGKTACKDCHTEAYVPYPHLKDAKAKIKGCVSCHQNPAKTIVPEFNASKHFKQHSQKFTCLSCHDSHTMRKAAKIGSAHLASVQDNAMCSTCHDDDARYGKLKSDGKRPDMAAVHDWLPEMELHLNQVRCIDCHTPAADITALSHDVQAKEKAVRKCETCHVPDTDLGRRLYKRLLKDQPGEQGGFANRALLKEVYVVGANRNSWFDWGALAALVLTAGVVAGRAIHRRVKNARQRRM